MLMMHVEPVVPNHDAMILVQQGQHARGYRRFTVRGPGGCPENHGEVGQ